MQPEDMEVSHLMAAQSVYTKLRQNFQRQCTLLCLYPAQLGLVKTEVNTEDVKIWLQKVYVNIKLLTFQTANHAFQSHLIHSLASQLINRQYRRFTRKTNKDPSCVLPL